jgi:thiamine biosynthesis protein ThiS
VVVNGEVREVAAGTNVAELIRELGLASERVAVERNGRIVRRAEHERTVLEEGDRVEVVTLVGGG